MKENKKKCSFCQKEGSSLNPIIGLEDGNTNICYSCNHNFLNIFQKEIYNSLSPTNEKRENFPNSLLDELKNDFNNENQINNENKLDSINLIYPKELYSYLNEYIIGQEEAKKNLSIAIHNHYKKINNQSNSDIELDKSNILMVGPSGSGKTLLVKTLSKKLEVPMVMVDATSMTQSGYVGDDVETILTRLYQAANGDIKKAERGIIFIDEIDKIAKNRTGNSITKDVNGEGVQQALLKIIEGTTSSFPLDGNRIHPGKENPLIDTSNILFIFGGAFEGINDIIEERLNEKKSIGFKNNKKLEKNKSDNIIEYLDMEDLIHFGFIPEFIGRIPVIIYLKELTKKQLKQTMLEPKNSIINQFKYMLSLEKINLEITDEYIDNVADLVIKKKVGARGIRNILEKDLVPYMFNIEKYQNKTIELKKVI